MIKPKTLQQRLSLYLLLPVALLLIVMGFAGFIYARNILLSQWREASVLKLQRAAHQVDMRLMRVKDWIRIFHQTSDNRDSFALSGSYRRAVPAGAALHGRLPSYWNR